MNWWNSTRSFVINYLQAHAISVVDYRATPDRIWFWLLIGLAAVWAIDREAGDGIFTDRLNNEFEIVTTREKIRRGNSLEKLRIN